MEDVFRLLQVSGASVQFRFAPPSEMRPRVVTICGSFDNWESRRPMRYDVSTRQFVLEMALPTAPTPGKKFFYKYVVDGVWMTNKAAPTERDPDGNENNVLVSS